MYYMYNPLCFHVLQDSLVTIKKGGNPGRIYSNRCPSQPDNDELMLDALNFLSLEFGVIPLGLAKTFAATSCEQIISGNPQSKAGMYWFTNGTAIQQEYCNF